MKIALITGSRADRNALEMVNVALLKAGHDVSWVVVGSGSDKIPLVNVEVAIEKIHIAAIGRDPAGYFADLAIVHGDRHEVLAAVIGANVLGIPIVHLGGGDLTEGSQDDCFRHAITKLSHLHFPTNQDAADRIVQMGEQPERVHMVGDAGIDKIMATPTMGRDETFAAIGLTTPERCLLVVYHPNTLGDTAAELAALSEALSRRPEGAAMVLIGPNADDGSDLIRKEWKRKEWKRLALQSGFSEHDVVYHENLPPEVFLSLMRWCDVMVGNSSAGLYEAPSFGTPTLNIGDRQQGRPIASSVTTVRADVHEITHGIKALLAFAGFGKQLMVKNPYGDGHAAERIAKVICEVKDPKALLRKKWCSLEIAMA